jgi:hypothetical protein
MTVVAELTVIAARDRDIVVDLSALDRVRTHARNAGGDLLLAGPQQQAFRLTLTPPDRPFTVHACVDEAARCSARSRRSAAPTSGPTTILART